MGKLTSKRSFFLRLMRRKLAQDLDDMGYPGGRIAAENDRAGGVRTGEIIQARERLEDQERRLPRKRALQR
jgi:hypothetical protein